LLDDGLYLAVFAYFAFFNRASGLYLLFSISFLSNICEYMKLGFSNPRPYYAMNGIQPLACSNPDFGGPSGHLFGATL